MLLSVRARSASSSSGCLPMSTRAERSPAAIERAVTSIAASGRVSRRARRNATATASPNASALPMRKKPRARSVSSARIFCVSTSTGVPSRLGLSGCATNTIPARRPVCSWPAASASASRSSTATPLGSCKEAASPERSRAAMRLPPSPTMPSVTVPSGRIVTSPPPEMLKTSEMRRPMPTPVCPLARRTRSCVPSCSSRVAISGALASSSSSRGIDRGPPREGDRDRAADDEHAHGDGRHRDEQAGAEPTARATGHWTFTGPGSRLARHDCGAVVCSSR